jgi:hypothetical protein
VLAVLAPVRAEAGVKQAVRDTLRRLSPGSVGEPAEAVYAEPAPSNAVPSEELPAPESDDSGSDDAAATGAIEFPVTAPPLEPRRRPRSHRRDRLAAVIVSLLALIAIGAPAAALALFRTDGHDVSTATPSAAAGVAATASTTPTATPTAIAAIVSTEAVESSTTATPVAVGAALTEPGLAAPTASPPTSTPIAATAGTEVPPLSAPSEVPADSPEGGQPSGAPPATASPDIQPPASQPPVPPPPCTPALAVSPQQLAFDTTGGAQLVFVTGEGCGAPLGFTVTPDTDWIAVVPRSGSVASGSGAFLTVSANRDGARERSGHIQVTSAAGSYEILVTLEAPPAATATPASTPDACRTANCPTPTPPGGPGGLVTP